jgi:hypothetical protein
VLTWMGFLGKLIEFVATKLVGKKLDLALDEKKKACKAFLKLLDSLTELESLLGDFIEFVETFVGGNNSQINRDALEKITKRLGGASSEFFDSLKKLGPIISLYDPQIARLLSRIAHAKLRIGVEASHFLRASNDEYSQDGSDRNVARHVVMRFDTIVFGNLHIRGLDFTLPTEELMAVDLNNVYEQARNEPKIEHPGDPIFGYSREIDYASTDILLNLVKDKYVEIRLGPDDIYKLIDLYPTFKAHRQVLRQAINSLREFMRLNFSFEDLLYVMT